MVVVFRTSVRTSILAFLCEYEKILVLFVVKEDFNKMKMTSTVFFLCGDDE